MRPSLWLYHHLFPFHKPLMALAVSSWLGSTYQLLLPWCIRYVMFHSISMTSGSILCTVIICLGEVNHRFQGAKSPDLFSKLKHHTRSCLWRNQSHRFSSDEEAHTCSQTMEQLPALIEEITKILLYQNAHFFMQSILYVVILFQFSPALIGAYAFLLWGMWQQSKRTFNLKNHCAFLKKRHKKLQYLQYELSSKSSLMYLNPANSKVHARLAHASLQTMKAEILLQKKQEKLRVQTSMLVIFYYLLVLFFLAQGNTNAIDYCYLLMMTLHVCSSTQYQTELLAYVHQKLDLLTSHLQKITPKISNTTTHKNQTLTGLYTSNLSFCYPNGPQALLNWSFEFKMGKSYAIIGSSGKGKSTLLKLLTGMLSPQKGKIVWTLEHKNTSSIDLSQITYFPQIPIILNQSLSENIICGAPLNKKELIQAIKDACLQEWVSELPHGVYTQITPERVSVGLQQRIAWARAFYQDACVWVMDEPCSALNHELKEQLFLNLERKSRTRLVIASTHCGNLTKRFDQIVYLDRNNHAKEHVNV